MNTATHPRHERLFTEPRTIDVAFAPRDVDVECGFLEYLSRNLGRGRLGAYLEVCCGPGYHLRHLAAQGVRAYGTCVSPEMVAYLGERDRPAKSAPVTVQLTEPLDFALPEAVDLAFCPRASIRYLLRDQDVITHLVTVAKNLGRGGLYVIDMPHPRSFLGVPTQAHEWVAQSADLEVRVRITNGPARMDPITQIQDQEIVFEIREGDRTCTVRDSAPVRSYTHPEMRALVTLSGMFDWVATFGDLSITQPFDQTEGARAMIPVLRCSV